MYLTETTTQLDYATGQVLETDPVTGLPLQPQAKTYSYNAFNQNISVTNADGSYQQNIYDALGLRISTIENGYRSDYVFDRESIIAEFDRSGTLTSRNIRGYGLIAQKDDKGRLNYYLHNAHGDVTSLIDASGKVLNSYQYDAFGNTMTYSATVANRFLYAGEQLDTITGQYYLRARYYDPTVGRFTQEDTYRGDSLNLYSYVGNNPVKYVDPSGLCKDEIIAAVDEHILYNPNISETAKKQLRKIIGKGTGKDYSDYPTSGSSLADGFAGGVKSVDDALFRGLAGKLSNEIKKLFGIEENDWERLQENPDYNVAYQAGSYTNAIVGIVNLGQGLKQIATSGGTIVVNGAGEVVSVISGSKEAALQAIAGAGQSIAGIANATSNNSSSSGGEGNTSKSLKSVGNNKRANEIAEQLGFEAEGGMRPAEVLKSNYVDDISHFDIMKNTQTNEIVLQSKNGVIVETGLKLPK